MSALDPQWLVRLYPPRWRARYGDELADLLDTEGAGPLTALNIIRAATGEWLFDHARLGGLKMQAYRADFAVLVSKPSALAPLAMSLAALALLLGYLTLVGSAVQPQLHDEGGPARLYQLLIFGQLPILAWFALRWLKLDFRAGLTVLALQALAIALSFVPLLILES